MKVMAQPGWFRRHYAGMIISGIAAYTAFLSFGGRQFLSSILTEEWQLLPWIAPTIIGLIAIKAMDRKYGMNKTNSSTQ